MNDSSSSGASIPQQLRTVCQQLASGVTSLHPLANQVADEAARSEIIRALFELTKNIEVIKKQSLKLEKGDDSRLV